jgi:membrane-bound lytic murein transglycosylase F
VVQPVRDLAEARGSAVVVPSASGWRGLAAKLPADLEPMLVDGAPTAEDVLDKVAAGEIGLALVRQDLARMEAARQPLTVGPPIGVTVGSRVAFRGDAPGLDAAFGQWLGENEAMVERLRKRYLDDARGWAKRADSAMAVVDTGTLSPYDELLQQSAVQHGMDWRLLAALSYQESRWRRNARSFAGAVGLMQLMPATARQVGVRNRADPGQSIGGGARYLAWLDKTWAQTVPDPALRLPLVLASYNAGLGHVADARRLASANGEDPDSWDVVAEWMLRLEQPDWADHPLVQHGWCRGSEPVHYVQAVIERWQHFQAVAPAVALTSAS